MIPVIVSEDLADFIDVFCDKGFFTVEDTERILMAGMKYGLTAKFMQMNLITPAAFRQV